MSITCSYPMQLSDPLARSPKTLKWLAEHHFWCWRWVASWALVHPGARSCSVFPLESQLSWKVRFGHIPMSGSGSCQAWLLLFSPTPLQQGARHLGHPWGELLRSRLSMAGSHGAACMWESGCGWGWDCWSPVLTGLQAELHAHPPPTHSGKEGALHTLV